MSLALPLQVRKKLETRQGCNHGLDFHFIIFYMRYGLQAWTKDCNLSVIKFAMNASLQELDSLIYKEVNL